MEGGGREGRDPGVEGGRANIQVHNYQNVTTVDADMLT